jgi:hypothetical protein
MNLIAHASIFIDVLVPSSSKIQYLVIELEGFGGPELSDQVIFPDLLL